MTDLAEFQFEILPSEGASDGFVFGIGAEISVNDAGFDPGEHDWIVQDSVNSRRGNAAFGRDVLGPKTWVWESHTNVDKVSEAVDVLERFSAAWAPQDLVETPGAQTALRYQIGGRDRRVFGRPRRFAAPPTNLILGGYVDVTHDFKLVDSRSYDDLESQALMPYNSTVYPGGFVFPAVFPLITTGSEGIGGGQVTVGGNARTYPIVRFNGPWVNPSLVTEDWELAWFGSLSAGQWVEIDTRPWAGTVVDQSGASAVGDLSRRVILEDCYFKPQTQPQIALDGVSTSGSATASIRWRNAWTSI